MIQLQNKLTEEITEVPETAEVQVSPELVDNAGEIPGENTMRSIPVTALKPGELCVYRERPDFTLAVYEVVGGAAAQR